MTRDEHRRACIEAMDKAFWKRFDEAGGERGNEAMASALDSLPLAGARVVPIEATEEMKQAADKAPWGYSPLDGIWLAMSAAGDLTNPPEGKPTKSVVSCPRARSDMTPCIARDGKLAVADNGECVGCGINANAYFSANPPEGEP